MRDRFLKKLADWHAAYPGRMLIIALALTALFAALSTRISVTMRWSDLLPSEDKRTLEYNKIIDEFSSATSIIILAQGEEKNIEAFADAIAPKLTAIRIPSDTGAVQAFRRVDYKAEMDFLRDHGLMLAKASDLKNMKEIFTDPNLTGLITNLNNAMEKEYVGQQESISTRQKEDQAVMFLEGVRSLVALLDRAAQGETVAEKDIRNTADKLLFGDTYFLSYDRKALILNVVPNFSVQDLDLVIAGTDSVQARVNAALKSFPGVKAGLTGFMPVCRDEMTYSEQSLGATSLFAVIAILILLIIAFRMWLAPLFAMANLLIGIIWAIGIVAVIVEQLNIMTQMMAVILLGLGIDFSIHLISGFTELRAQQMSIRDALETTFLKTGKGVITGALTTAFAFFAMMISQSRGMKEMGIVTGSGLLAVLVATFFVLPIFLVYRERRHDRKQKLTGKVIQERDLSFQSLGQIGHILSRHWGWTLLAALLLTAFLIWQATKITFDSNYMHIEPKGLASITLQDTMLAKFDMSADYAMVLAADPAASRQIAEAMRDKPTAAMVDDISTYLPSKEEQNKRRPHLAEIQKIMQDAKIKDRINLADLSILEKQIDRLRMNVIEMQDMAYIGGQDKVDRKCRQLVGSPDDPELQDRIEILINRIKNANSLKLFEIQRQFAPYFKKSVLRMAKPETIHLPDLPENILDQYCNTDRTQYLVTVFPAGSVWQDANFLRQFVADLESVTDKATGMPPVFLALIEIIGRDGRIAMLLTLIVIFILLWLDFRNPKHALIAMIPLVGGLAWMVGLMKLTGQQFTVVNVMGLPMILGIGIDDGVHIIHRWVAEGKGRLRTVFASTGKAILLTSLTTMLGFGSLVFSIWRGFGQLGAALFVGVGACFLTTILFLGAILGWIERK